MTSFCQIEANRRNARRSTGPITEEGKERSRRNAVRHGLAAETVIGALEDAEDYKAFEAAITVDYDAPSAVERELVLQLASLLWRLRRATAIETGLFATELEDVGGSEPSTAPEVEARTLFFARAERLSLVQSPRPQDTAAFALTPALRPEVDKTNFDPSELLAPTFLRLANLPNFSFDRLNRYEVALWRQIERLLLILDALDRRKPQERRRR